MGFFSHFMGGLTHKTEVALPEEAILIDVRTHAEYASGHIEGAMHLPLDRISHDVHRVAPDKAAAVVLYCRSGARSGHALSLMRQMGYQNVHNGGGVGALAMRLGKNIRRA